MYRRIAEEEDNKMAERWQKAADGILIFVSSQLTFRITSHIRSTNIDRFVLRCSCGIGLGDRHGPQTKLTGYIRNLSREYLSASRRSQHTSIVHPCRSTQPPPFSPPKYVIWVNSLWFLSLAISLTCAMLATLIQQWARRYLRRTHRPRDTLHESVQSLHMESKDPGFCG